MFQYIGQKIRTTTRSLSNIIRRSFFSTSPSENLPLAPPSTRPVSPPPNLRARKSQRVVRRAPPFELRPLAQSQRMMEQTNAEEIDTLPLYFKRSLKASDMIIEKQAQIMANKERACKLAQLYTDTATRSSARLIKKKELNKEKDLNLQQDYRQVVLRHRQFKYKYELGCFPLIKKQDYLRLKEVWLRDDQTPAVNHPHISQNLTYRTLQTLNNKNWLNDQVVNAIIRLYNLEIARLSSAFRVANSHFFNTVKGANAQKINRILKKLGFQEGMTLIVPLNQGRVHWNFCIFGSKLKFCDSFSSEHHGSQAQLAEIYELVMKRKAVIQVAQYPRQQNSHDCGVFMLSGIRDVVAGREEGWSFAQHDMKFRRAQLGVQLIKGQLLAWR